MKVGDVVKHGPTGEEWLVWGVDSRPARMHVYPAGWPPCRASIADCEVTGHHDGFPSDDELASRAKQWPGVRFDDMIEAET